jgi:hypothetical protein
MTAKKLNTKTAAKVATPVDAAPVVAPVAAQAAALATEQARLAKEAQDKAERHAAFVLAIETAASTEGKRDKERASVVATIAASIPEETRALTAWAFENWKRDVKAHYIAAYMTARGYAATFAAVRALMPINFADKANDTKGIVAKEWGKRLAPSGTNDLDDWLDAADKGGGCARVLITYAFKDAKIDIGTAGPLVDKPKGANDRATDKPDARKAALTDADKVAGATIHIPTARETIATAPAVDIADALGEMDTATLFRIFMDTSRKVAANKSTKGVKRTIDEIDVAKRVLEIIAGYNMLHTEG